MDGEKILITGAAGRIGTFLRESWVGHYDMVLLDCRDVVAPGDAQAINGDIREFDVVREACEGVDTVVHLAAHGSPEAEFHTSVLPMNIIGTHNVYEAAADAGVKRVIFASSIHAVGAYPPDVQVKWDMPVRPCCDYGASKCYGESVGSYFSDRKGLSVIAIRIGGVHGHDYQVHHDVRLVDTGISEQDLVQLMTKCVDASSDIRFLIVNGISNNRFKRLDISHEREVLGYQPTDDSAIGIEGYDIPIPTPIHM